MINQGAALQIRLCGDFGIDAPGVDLPTGVLPGRQGRLVFAYLVCARGRAVARDELAELLWPDQLPDSWTTSLSAVVSKLRRLLSATGLDAGTALVSSTGGIELDLPEGVWVDWEVAHEALELAEAAVADGDPTTALEAAAEALALADRGFLADPCPWVDTQREAAREVCVRAVIAAGEAHLLAGASARAVDSGRDAVARAPGREAGHRLLMVALAASGERAEALRAWERCRAEVIDELGVEPSTETEAIYLQLLDTDHAELLPTADGVLPSGVVTFLLTDIVGSSGLWERDATAMDRALERHDALIGQVVADHDGTLLKSKLEGDATVSVFARATSAVLATLALTDALSDEVWPEGMVPALRMAVHTGEAVERGGDYFGPALNRAARLRALAGAGQILLSQAAAELVLDHLPEGVQLAGLGHHDLRGLSRGEHVYELTPTGELAPDRSGSLLAARPPMPTMFDSGDPFVGRDPELERLTEVFAGIGSSGPRAVLVAGEPGVGKSRLAAEVAAAAHTAGAVVLAGRCDEELGAPLQPFAECLRQLAPCLDPGGLANLQGLEELSRLVPGAIGGPASDATRSDPEAERYALFDGFARLLAAVCAEAPVVLVLDDLHWAGKTTLLLLRHILRHAGPAPILVLGTYRDTELGRTHPLAATLADLRRDGTAERITLSGLEPEDVAAYLRAVGREDRALGTELARVTAGNPFFLIETLRHVVESGGRWDPDELPEGVRETTGRRLSRLSESANELLHVAAVAGPVFPLELIEEICGRELVDEIAEACDAGLVGEDEAPPGRFRFAHALVRQVLLGELVTIRRVRLHRAIAEVLEARPTSDPDVQLTELARHWFECASAGDADRAVIACRRAADRAAERLAHAEAAELYGMAAQASAATPDTDERAELLVARVDALLAAGDAVPIRAALDDLEEAAETSARWTSWHATLTGQLVVVADPERMTGIITGLREAATVLHDEGDGRGEARAHYVHALALERLGRIGAAEQTLDRALAAARACDDRRLVDVVLASAPEAALWGPSPVTRASGRCLDVVRVLRITGGAPAVEAVALRCQAVLEALRGRIDAARTMVAAARQTFEELGLGPHLLETDVAAGYIELAHANPVEAEAHVRPALDSLRERGLDGETARAAALLGRALMAQGRVDEAAALGDEAARLAGADLRASVGWRTILGLVAAAREDRTEALRLAHEAVELSSATDALLLEVDARMALAEVLRAVGDDAAATDETRRAVALCERKGATALAEITSRRIPDAGRPSDDGDQVGPLTEVGIESDTDGRTIAEHSSFIDGSARPERFDGGIRVKEYEEAFRTGDIDALRAFWHPDISIQDQRTGRGGAVYGADQMLAQHQYLFSDTSMTCAVSVVGSRGEHLSLVEARFVGRWQSTAEAELVQLGVQMVDGHGRITRVAVFDADDLDAAFATLDEWYVETDTSAGVRHQGDLSLYEDPDPATFETNSPPDLVVEDHRLTGHWTFSSRAAFFEHVASMRRGVVDLEQRHRHVLACDRGVVAVVDQKGGFDLDGSGRPVPFEYHVVSVQELDNEGLVVRIDLYDEDQLDDALARYDALAAGTPPARPPGWERFGAWRPSDTDDLSTADLDPSMRIEDHRSLVGVPASGADEVMARWHHLQHDASMRRTTTLIATRGDRLTLDEIRLRGSWGSSGETEVSFLSVAEQGDHGTIRAAFYDADDLDTAFTTLDEWYLASRQISWPSMLTWQIDFDAGALAKATDYLASDAVFEDHRPLSLETVRGREAILEVLAAMWAALPSVAVTPLHVLEHDRAGLGVATMSGSVDPGATGDLAPFETLIVSLNEYDDNDLAVHWHIYAEDQLPEALARFDALAPGAGRPASFWETAVHPNFLGGNDDAFNSGDEAAYRAILHPELRVHDLRAGHQQEYGLDELMTSLGFSLGDARLRVTTRPVGTRPPNLCLAEHQFHGTWGPSGEVELALLSVTELGEDGRAVRTALYDLDGLDAAFRTLEQWHLERRDPALPPNNYEHRRRYLDMDWDGLRELFAPDLVVEDHRLTGTEVRSSRDDYFEHILSMCDQLVDASIRTEHLIECPRGVLAQNVNMGTVDIEGTGDALPFENRLVVLMEWDADGLVCRWDFFDDYQLPEAVARFEELRQ